MPMSFLDFPVEINFQILQECGANDIACLSLTCKYLYFISTELRTPRLSLSTPDTRLCPPHSCPNTHERNRACNILRRHRRICHFESLAAHEGWNLASTELAVVLGVDRNECQTPHWTPHCECYVITLYKRLETWVPKGLRFCTNCRIFTRGCGHDGRFCAVHVRRARWEFAERERLIGIWDGWIKEGELEERKRKNRKTPAITVAESSAMGAATKPGDLARMQETWESMKRQAREEMQKRLDDLKIREEALKEKEEEVKRKERGLRKRWEELWRRRDKLKESEDRLRKREDQLRKAEEEFGKKGKGYKDEKFGSSTPRSSIGFTRRPCRESSK